MSRQERIYHALSVELKPETLIVENESHQHNVPPGSETHFKIIAVSDYFITHTTLSRNRLINKLLSSEWGDNLHALSLHLYTPEEWLKKKTKLPLSPACKNRKQKNS